MSAEPVASPPPAPDRAPMLLLRFLDDGRIAMTIHSPAGDVVTSTIEKLAQAMAHQLQVGKLARHGAAVARAIKARRARA